jgi:DNA-binding transcriptional ArsR family regulator
MNEMLDFVKAMSNPHRLRIIGLLSQESATRAEIAARLNLSAKDALDHLTFLEYVGAVAQTDGIFSLNNDKLAVLAREKLAKAHPSYTLPDSLDENSKKVLKTYLNSDGSIRQIPASPKLQAILNYLIQFFEFNTNYTEKEVNAIQDASTWIQPACAVTWWMQKCWIVKATAPVTGALTKVQNER